MRKSDNPLKKHARAKLEQPPLDARMDGHDFVAFLQVPGLVEAPTISLGRDRLVVEGLLTGTSDAASGRSRAVPRGFAREIALPPGLDRDQLQVDYVGGVLRIFIPRHEMAVAA